MPDADPISSRRLKNRLLEQIHEFHVWRDRVKTAPAPESVHQLRITLRKLEAAAWLLEGEPRLAAFAKLSRSLRKRGRSLGRIRELDVASLLLKEHELGTKGLRKKRIHEERKIKHRQDKKLGAILDSFGAAVKALPRIDLTASLYRLREEMRTLRGTSATSRGELHRLRIRLKLVRYALRFLGRDDKDLQHLQEMLGRLHDYQSIPKELRSRSLRRERDRAHRESIRQTPRRLRAACEHVVHKLAP